MNPSSPTFCWFPYQHLTMSHAIAAPCCDIRHPYDIDEIKKQQSAGIFPDQCEFCKIHEERFGNSLRIRINHPGVFKVQIVTGNVCNIKCLSCEWGSRKRMKEYNHLFTDNSRPIDTVRLTKVSQLPIPMPDDVNVLMISGGEPFFDNSFEFLEDYVRHGHPTDIIITIVTNMTCVSIDKLKWLKDNFNKVTISASLDAFQNLNHYLRYPTNWVDVEQSVANIKLVDDIELFTGSALSNLSMFNYAELIKWAHDREFDDVRLEPIIIPDMMSPKYLTYEMVNYIRPKILKIRSDLESLNSKHVIPCDKMLSYLDDASGEFQASLEWYLIHDKHRGNSIYDVIPNLETFL